MNTDQSIDKKRKAAKSDCSYLEALRKIRKLVAENYPEGGWLPSGRAMCAEYNICRNTYRKAVKFLEKEGLLKSHPRTGHFVQPEFLRSKKVGIILGDAESSPFLQNASLLGALLQTLEENRLDGHLLQSTDHDSLWDQADIHDVQGLIWLIPPPKLFPLMDDIHHRSGLPFIAVDTVASFDDEPHDFPTVNPSFRQIAEAKADYLIKGGHRKVVYIAPAKPHCHSLFEQKLQKAGIATLFLHQDDCSDLRSLIEAGDTSGVLIDGGVDVVYRIFQNLSTLDTSALLDLYIHSRAALPAIRAAFPGIRATALGSSDSALLGARAGQMMADQLLDGKRITSEKVDYFKIERVDANPITKGNE
jgi:DNA-binding transcriptional regulator YhcF (GntR family)